MKHLFLIIITILLFGFSVFCRKLAVDRIHPYQLQVVAGLVYAVEIPIWLYLINKNNIVGYNPIGIMFAIFCVASSVIAAVIFGFLLKSSNATGQLSILIATNPMITLFLSMIFLGESFSLKKGIACFFALAGLILFNT